MLTGTWTFRNISAPLCASISAMSWGVETITAPNQKKSKIVLSFNYLRKYYFQNYIAYILKDSTTVTTYVICINFAYYEWERWGNVYLALVCIWLLLTSKITTDWPVIQDLRYIIGTSFPFRQHAARRCTPWLTFKKLVVYLGRPNNYGLQHNMLSIITEVA